MANIAYCTADGLINYDTIPFVNEVHKHNCLVNGWKYTELKRGMFGFDNLIHSIHEALFTDNYEKTIENVARKIHIGWCKNYIYWRENLPYLRKDYKYYNPAKPINDERRNYCASTSFDELNDEEKEKDVILAKFLINYNL